MSTPSSAETNTDTGVGRAPDDLFNIAEHLPRRAREHPYLKAVIFPEGRNRGGQRCYSALTYQQLDQLSDRAAHGLLAAGIGPGTRTLLMVKPGPSFVALTFALFKTGAVPVLIDPGMGKANLARAVADVSPQALVGIPLAHLFRRLKPAAFRSVETLVTVDGRRWLWGGQRLDALMAAAPPGAFEVAPTRAGDPAAILFTTGSTGPPKGVCYTHGMFGAQVEMIRRQYGIRPGEVDMPCFPLFVLFSVAFGATSVIPDMDPTRPAQVDPPRLVEAIIDHGVSYSFGSPAIWRRVGEWCDARDVTLPSLERILMAGAPVPPAVLERFTRILPNGDTHTPYGATESLPVCSASGRQILAETAARSAAGAGTCVGRPLPGVTVTITRIRDEPIARWDQVEALPAGEIGEICVKGPMVTHQYHALPEQTAAAKIADGDDLWHRMGDVGWLDAEGRLWFCGRKAHRVETAEGPMYTVPCEAIFNEHPAVFRSALVGLGPRGAQRPLILIELAPGHTASATLERELLALGAQGTPETARITALMFHPGFPTDIRHNAKIFREKLAVWAAARSGGPA